MGRKKILTFCSGRLKAFFCGDVKLSIVAWTPHTPVLDKILCMKNSFNIKIMVKSNAIEIVSIPDFWEPFWIYQLINNTYPAKLYSKDYLQLPLRQWGAGNFYFLVLSSWKVDIAENPIALMGL